MLPISKGKIPQLGAQGILQEAPVTDFQEGLVTDLQNETSAEQAAARFSSRRRQ
jgi:hypothetical protein